MARKQEISFLTDIQSDEQFEEFLKQNVLLVLDVYEAMYGPCVSLQNTLEQQKDILEEYFNRNEEEHMILGYDFEEYLPVMIKAVKKKEAIDKKQFRVEYEAAQEEKFAKLD
ncbi:hypothetical protein ACKWTF_012596 [Chironomus riparius]